MNHSSRVDRVGAEVVSCPGQELTTAPSRSRLRLAFGADGSGRWFRSHACKPAVSGTGHHPPRGFRTTATPRVRGSAAARARPPRRPSRQTRRTRRTTSATAARPATAVRWPRGTAARPPATPGWRARTGGTERPAWRAAQTTPGPEVRWPPAESREAPRRPLRGPRCARPAHPARPASRRPAGPPAGAEDWPPAAASCTTAWPRGVRCRVLHQAYP